MRSWRRYLRAEHVDQARGDDPKAEWRAWARKAREGLDISAISVLTVDALAGWDRLRAASVALIYLPLPEEPDLRALETADLDCRFVTTRTPDRGGSLTVHELGGPLEVHRLGFLQPHASAPEVAPADVDVWLLPGLAYDLWGTRLGRGAGYFDQVLPSRSQTATLVGVTPAESVVDRLPRQPHDVSVHYLATQEGIIEVARTEVR